jgi:hypothetical protein
MIPADRPRPPYVHSDPVLRFDPDAALALARALDALADRLELAVRRDAARMPRVTDEWRGCSRRWFDEHRTASHRRARRLAADARSEATLARRAIQG